MSDDDALIGQGIVDERNEARYAAMDRDSATLHRKRVNVQRERDEANMRQAAVALEQMRVYADEHECGQLHIAVPGEQVSLLPLPDSLIPTTQDEED